MIILVGLSFRLIVTCVGRLAFLFFRGLQGNLLIGNVSKSLHRSVNLVIIIFNPANLVDDGAL